ncbi:YeeE/YedE family protein [Natroniella sulfidigena]|uniref:YeeE/YedE thiosulfate transporter family protein n=1 Tax=Natroniella sulfidigena TaxID=723921 RepID=UPI00200B7C96|nr:YeeE/YedE thiosulfate transporter family protein [Natroniella sulfidigena]MCK8816099.1 YeeE/YedE family protein [Natroniella sulfidigena]
MNPKLVYLIWCILLVVGLIFNWSLLVILLLGIIIGVVLQRSNFCFAGGLVNFFFFKDVQLIKAILILIGVSTVGFMLYNIVKFPEQLPSYVLPWGGYTIIGGLLFGLGMVLAGGCVLGMLMRIGEGSVNFLIVLVGVIIGSNLGSFHLYWWQEYFTVQIVYLPDILGWFKSGILHFGILIIIYYILTKLMD